MTIRKFGTGEVIHADRTDDGEIITSTSGEFTARRVRTDDEALPEVEDLEFPEQ